MDMFCCLKLAALHLFGKRARRRALKTSLSLGFHEKACAAGIGAAERTVPDGAEEMHERGVGKNCWSDSEPPPGIRLS
jgi:hypothetical protein